MLRLARRIFPAVTRTIARAAGRSRNRRICIELRARESRPSSGAPAHASCSRGDARRMLRVVFRRGQVQICALLRLNCGAVNFVTGSWFSSELRAGCASVTRVAGVYVGFDWLQ